MADRSTHDAAQLLADVNWQLAKGYLRAVVAVHGAALDAHRDGGGSKYERLGTIVEGFIVEVEHEELNL